MKNKKKEDKKLTKDQAEKKIQTLKKDLFNLRFKKINGQVENPAQYRLIKRNIARLFSNINSFFCIIDSVRPKSTITFPNSKRFTIPLSMVSFLSLKS